jgi:hypothetical protein
MGTRRKVARDVVLLERKVKYAKSFQREFEKHIERLERLLKLAKNGKSGQRK